MGDLDFEREKISKLFFSYGAASVIGVIVFCLYSLIDSIFIGRYAGENGMAAVTLSAPVLSLFCALALTSSIGGSTLISTALGNKDSESASQYYSMCIVAMIIISGVVTGLMVAFPGLIASIFCATGEVYIIAVQYIRINGIFALFFLFQGFLSNILNAIGKPVVSMISNICTALVNIAFDYLFVAVLGYGVAGAAIASGIATVMATLICVAPLLSKRSVLRFSKIRIDWKLLLHMAYNGMSDGLSAVSTGVLALILNWQIVRLFQNVGLTAFGVVQALFQFFGSILMGFTGAINPIIAFNYGANNLRRIKETLSYFYKAIFIIAIILAIILVCFKIGLIGLFGEISADSALMTRIYLCYCVMLLFAGGSAISLSYFTAINVPKTSALLALCRVLVFRIGMAIVLPVVLGKNGLWLSIPVSEILACVIGISYTIHSVKAQAGRLAQDG